MRSAVATVVLSFFAGAVASGQDPRTLFVCDLEHCYAVDTAVMGGMRFEDYRVTNPAAVQFDPAQRLKELAGLGTATADTLCKAPPSFTPSVPTINFDKNSVVAQIYWVTPFASFAPSEFMDVQFSNLTASNGYSSSRFGFRMVRVVAADGSEIPQYQIQLQAGNAGLENVVGLGQGVGFGVDPVGKTALVFGSVPSPELLRQAILAVFVNAQAILSAAKFTVTNPAPPGKTLWPTAEIISLAAQAQPWIAAGTGTTIPPGPPYKCTPTLNGYGVCEGGTGALPNAILTWGGEYLGRRTRESFDVLASNLLTWARADAPSIDPDFAATGHSIWLPPLSKPILMLWPTLRADPALSAADRETIERWIRSVVAPRPHGGWYSNDLGYFAESVNMADAIGRSDHTGFAQGIAQFYGALQQMRPDGSFPLAAQLSACSSVYSNVDLEHLVSIAEMAATQGYDLYSRKFEGRSLDTAINFMLDAFENPALLFQYSKAGGGICFEGNPGDPPDFRSYSQPDSSLTWMEAYIARFPFSATAGRLRKILGSSVSAPPFPLMDGTTGLNATCAFRKSYEFQPVNGAKVAIVSGNGQTVNINQAVPAPFVVRVTDNTGKPLAGALVSFAVVQGSANIAAPAQVLTDADGMASASATILGNSGPVSLSATALGVRASFSITVPGPAISAGGIAGIGGSVPAVTTISPGGLFSLYGQDFVPAGTGRRATAGEIVNGVLPANLLGVCVSVGESNAPLLDVYPGQINAVAPAIPVGSRVQVIVTTGCGTPNAIPSLPQLVSVEAASPEFLFFARNADGQNPVAAVNASSGANVGPASLGTGFVPAHPGDFITIFGSGFGPTDPLVPPGAVASGAAKVTNPVTVTLGNVTLGANDVLYAGAAPGSPISQLNIRIPAGIPAGNQQLQIQIGGIASPAGAFLIIALP